MAKNTQPIAKRCKALGISPAVMGYAKKNTTRNSNGNMRKKQSEYATQLKEKQKVKFIYGVLEKQFHGYFNKARKMRLAPARPVRTCCRSWSAVWTTSCSVWALLRPAATLVSWSLTLTSPSTARRSTSPLTSSRPVMSSRSVSPAAAPRSSLS